MTADPSRAAPLPDADSRAVILFARSPRREAREKRIRDAERLFALARDRVVRATLALGGVELVVVGDAGLRLPGGCRMLHQRGCDFGERLGNAFADVRALGFELIVAVGIDAPALGAEHLAAAFERLAVAGAVLGPAADGGVYLLGARGDVAAWFEGVRWQTEDVLAQLRARRPSAALLPATLTDVDHFANLAEILAAADGELGVLIRRLLAPAPRPCPLAPAPPPSLTFAFPISRRGPPQAPLC